MRASRGCPKCGGTSFLVCKSRQRDPGSVNLVFDMCITVVPFAELAPRGANVLAGVPHPLFPDCSSTYYVAAGQYETWVCAGCGYTEWYALDDPKHYLYRLSQVPGSGVQFVEEKRDPYR